MAKGTKICKVCGKEYEYCKTWLSTDKFRYQDVACSPECGAKYFAAIEASRMEKPAEKTEKKQPKKMATTTQVKEPEVVKDTSAFAENEE